MNTFTTDHVAVCLEQLPMTEEGINTAIERMKKGDVR